MSKTALLALLVLFIPLSAFAAPALELETQNTDIKSLDTVLVFGSVTGVADFRPVTLAVIAPDGETLYSYKIQVDSNGDLKQLIHPPIPEFQTGTYTVTLSHPDTAETAQIEFSVTPETIPRKEAPASVLQPEEPLPGLESPGFEQPLYIEADAVEGDTVIDIIGKTIVRDQTVSLTVTSPQGNIVTVAQVTPTPSGDFSASITTGGPLWNEDGEYTVTAYQGRSSELQDSVAVGIRDGVVIPEFGTIAALVLGVSIMSILVLARTRTAIFPKI